MSFDPGEGTSDGRIKPKTICFEVEIKQEPVIKDERLDGIELNCVHSQIIANEQDKPNQMIKSESETDSEFSIDFDLEADDLKVESKSNENKLKIEKDTKKNSKPKRALNGNEDARQSGPRRQIKFKSIGRKKERDSSRKQDKQTIPKNLTEKNQKVHKCQLCQYKSTFKYNLLRHMLSHTGERPFQCDACVKNFTQNSSLNNHMKIHASMFQYHCPNCRQGFSQESQFVDHEKKCELQRRYECYLCEYHTQYKHHMFRHMSIHSGHRPFECLVCLKSFTQKTGLSHHFRNHQNELQFGCSKCGHRFAGKDENELHEKRCNRRRFGCYLCRYESFQKNNLNQHMRAKHTGVKQFQCVICEMKFAERSNLNRHFATHREHFPYKCAMCRRAFAEEAEWTSHKKLCRCRRFQCYLCLAFLQDLRGHMHARHTGEKPFGCQMCGDRFTFKSNFNQHMNRVHNKIQ